VPNFDKPGQTLFSEARLVKLGNYIFIDLGTPNTYDSPNIPYPALKCHVFGRLTLGKDNAHLDFLSDDWIKDEMRAGQLSLAFEEPLGIVLTAGSSDLRKFALGHAEDHDAFSETFTLVRKN
jgi:hypothetical protein